MQTNQPIHDKIKKVAVSFTWQSLFTQALTVCSLSLILWMSYSIWEQSCRDSATLVAERKFCFYTLDALSPILVALGYWGLSLLPWFFQRRFLPFVLFQLCSAILVTGILSAENETASRVFNALLIWFSPLVVHFHLRLGNRSLQWLEKAVLSLLYLLAAQVSLLLLLVTKAALIQAGYWSILRLSTRLGLLAGFIIAVLFLIYEYKYRASLETRGRIRLISFGTIFAFTPMLLLSVLPEMLGADLFVSYTLTFPGLLLSPLSYSFLIFRDKLIPFEPAFNRFLIYYLSLSLLLSFYLVVIAIAGRFSQDEFALSPANVWVSVGILLAFPFVYNRLQQLIDWLLYGGEIDYLALLPQFSEALSLTLDQERLTRLLVHDLVSALHLRGGIVFLQDRNQQLKLADATGFKLEADIFQQPWQHCPVLTHLEAKAKPVLAIRLQQLFATASVGDLTQRLLALPEIAFWVPLISNGTLQGVLLLSSRRSGDHLSPRDENILIALSHQAGIAAYNVRLVAEVVQSQKDLSLAHQKLLMGREEERRRLAHELHDGAVQQLLGLSFRVATLRRQIVRQAQLAPQDMDEVRTYLLGIVNELRQMINGLRPAGLEELGLFAALEGYITRLKRDRADNLPNVIHQLTGDETHLPDPVAICLFRVTQEAIRNTLKHAKATQISLQVTLTCQQAQLQYQDNGRGFQVPAQLSSLTQQDHFGLVGMAEQVSWVGGQFAIDSHPHTGTCITISIPLTTAQEEVSELEKDRVEHNQHPVSG